MIYSCLRKNLHIFSVFMLNYAKLTMSRVIIKLVPIKKVQLLSTGYNTEDIFSKILTFIYVLITFF